MKGVEQFDKAKLALPEFAIEIWQGWIFIALEDGPLALAERLAPVEDIPMMERVQRGSASHVTRRGPHCALEQPLDLSHIYIERMMADV